MTYPTKEEKAADIEKSGRITFFYSLTTQSSLKIQFATFFTYLHSFLIFLQVVARESNNFFCAYTTWDVSLGILTSFLNLGNGWVQLQ